MDESRGIASIVLNRREVIVRSNAEDFRYLKHHWGSAYRIIRPSQAGATWQAIAKFGNQDELIGATADELLGLIRRHYGPETEGYPFSPRQAVRR